MKKIFLILLTQFLISGLTAQANQISVVDTIEGFFTPLLVEWRLDSNAFSQIKTKDQSEVAGCFKLISHIDGNLSDTVIYYHDYPTTYPVKWDSTSNTFVAYLVIPFQSELEWQLQLSAYLTNTVKFLTLDSTTTKFKIERYVYEPYLIDFWHDKSLIGSTLVRPVKSIDLSIWNSLKAVDDTYLTHLESGHSISLSASSTIDALSTTYPNSTFVKCNKVYNLETAYIKAWYTGDYTTCASIKTTVEDLEKSETRKDLKFLYRKILFGFH